MELPPFTLHQPRSIEEASQLLALHGNEVDLLAGGTDLLPNYKMRLNPKPHVVSLGGIGGLSEISTTRIGALVRLVELERSPVLLSSLPVVAETASLISSPPLREHGTVGGNLMLDTRCWFFNQSPLWRKSKDFCLKAEGTQCLVIPASNDRCYATYSGELAAAFLVLNARIELFGPAGARSVDLGEFFADDGIVRWKDKKIGEIVTGVTIPESATSLFAGYAKVRQRDSIDFPSLGVAAAFRLDSSGRIEELSVATTAMASRPERFAEATVPFIGQIASPDLARRIGEAVKAKSTAYKNVPLDPAWRKKMVSVYLRRLLARLDARFCEAKA